VIGSTTSHYRITEKVGEGGVGGVYQAEDTPLERAVALKFLTGHLLNGDEAKERFLREAKDAAALHHPNIYPFMRSLRPTVRPILRWPACRSIPSCRFNNVPTTLCTTHKLGPPIQV
jgi:serine/threonine protein kinase